MNKTEVEPMKAGLETITDAHIATTHKVTDKEVDAQIQKLKEVIDPNPYKIVEGSISDEEADDKEYERVRWEVRRYELAKDFVSASIMGCISAGIPWSKIDEITDGIAMADEMIKQLKNE